MNSHKNQPGIIKKTNLESGTSEIGFLKFEKWKVKIKSFHSFSRSAKWKKCFNSFSRSAKWNQNAFTLFREVKSEFKMLRDQENSREFLTILETRDFLTDLFRESQIRLLKQWLARGVTITGVCLPLNSFFFCYQQIEWEELPHMTNFILK